MQLETITYSDENKPQVTVRLSQRNILALLSKLDWDGSACTITRLCESDEELTVIAEEDGTHHATRYPKLDAIGYENGNPKIIFPLSPHTPQALPTPPLQVGEERTIG